MAFYAADPGSRGLEAFDHFSRKHPRYDRAQVLERWSNYGKYPPTRSSVGRLIYLANGGVLSLAGSGGRS